MIHIAFSLHHSCSLQIIIVLDVGRRLHVRRLFMGGQP